MKYLTLMLWLLASLAISAPDEGEGNEPGHGGDKVIRKFARAWKQSLVMVRDFNEDFLPTDTNTDEQIAGWLTRADRRKELYREIEWSPQIWRKFGRNNTLCGYTDSKHFAPFYLSKENCKDHTEEDAASHFLGEGAHHFYWDDKHAALIANAIVEAYQKKNGKRNPRIAELKLADAATRGDNEAIKKLLNPPYSTKVESVADGRTPLMDAALAGHESTVELLLDRGASINTKNYQGKDMVDLLVAPYPYLWNAGSLRIIFKFLPLSKNKQEKTNEFLYWAVSLLKEENDLDTLRRVANLGADAAARERAAQLAFVLQKFRFFQILLENGKLSQVLLRRMFDRAAAAKTDGFPWLQKLVENGFDVNGLNEKGENSVFAVLGKNEFLEALISKYKASPNIRNKEGVTPAGILMAPQLKSVKHWSSGGHGVTTSPYMTYEHETTYTNVQWDRTAVRTLVQESFDPNISSATFRGEDRPLSMALKQALWPDPGITKQLLARGAQTSHQDKHGFGAFDWICSIHDLYERTCHGHPDYNRECTQKWRKSIQLLQAKSPQKNYNPVGNELLAEVVPHMLRTVSHSIWNHIEKNPPPPPSHTYDFSVWCADARDKCGD